MPKAIAQQAKRGIAMTARNVPKVMDGGKTQTRRIESDLRNVDDIYSDCQKLTASNGNTFFRLSVSTGSRKSVGQVGESNWSVSIESATAWDDVYPKHQVGDILYVKEALERYEDALHSLHQVCAKYKSDGQFVVPAGDTCHIRRRWESDSGKPWKVNVLPARYMPRSAARTFIEITDVRCERIQDISVDDAIAEGVTKDQWENSGAVKAFVGLWDDTNGKGAWDRNDWVFAYTYRLVEAGS